MEAAFRSEAAKETNWERGVILREAIADAIGNSGINKARIMRRRVSAKWKRLDETMIVLWHIQMTTVDSKGRRLQCDSFSWVIGGYAPAPLEVAAIGATFWSSASPRIGQERYILSEAEARVEVTHPQARKYGNRIVAVFS